MVMHCPHERGSCRQRKLCKKFSVGSDHFRLWQHNIPPHFDSVAAPAAAADKADNAPDNVKLVNT
jgi:hypothetical protein